MQKMHLGCLPTQEGKKQRGDELGHQHFALTGCAADWGPKQAPALLPGSLCSSAARCPRSGAGSCL